MIEALLSEIDQEAKTTRSLLHVVPHDKWDWKPHEKSMTLGRLAQHVAELPAWGGQTLGPGETDFATRQRAPKPTTSAELLTLFEDGISSLKAALSALGPEDLAQKSYTMRHGEKVFIKVPRGVFVRSILLNHVVHHRGQLSVYLRLLDVPVPAIYGPSADENPWA
jgi:uncharacterized damage-inducible protein DinB